MRIKEDGSVPEVEYILDGKSEEELTQEEWLAILKKWLEDHISVGLNIRMGLHDEDESHHVAEHQYENDHVKKMFNEDPEVYIDVKKRVAK